MAISPILLNGSIQQTDNVLHNQLRQMEKEIGRASCRERVWTGV